MASRLRIAATYVTGLAACLMSGTLYGYGAWGPGAKAVFGWSQTETNLVGSVGDVGLSMGISMSLLCDFASPRIALLTGAALQGLGYTLMALAVWKIFVLPSWGLMAFFVFLVGQGSNGTNVGGFNPSLFNFPNRWTGVIMSTMMAAFALSSIIFTVVFKYVYRLPVVPPDPHLADSIGHYFVVLASTTFGVGLISAIFAVRLPLKPSAQQDADTALNATGETPLRLFTYMDFWLMVVVTFFIAASGLLQINNQGSIALSLGNGPAADSMVFILGFASVGGRLVTGFLSDTLASRGVPRSIYLAFAALLLVVAHTAFALDQPSMMYASTALTGYAYGTLASSNPTLLPVFWGKKWMSTNYGLTSIVAAVAGIVSGAVSGALYGRNADPATQLCVGSQCFRDAFLISGCCNIVSLLAALLLSYRTRRNVPLYDVNAALDEVAPTQPLLIQQSQ